MAALTGRSHRLARLLALLPMIGLLLAAGVLHGADSSAALLLKQGDRVAVVGDSITEQKQYSRFIEDYLTMCAPDLDLWVIQLGWGGETGGGFARRMDQDLFPFKPNLVTTCYGMNDGRYRAYEEGIGNEYRAMMEKIIKACKDAGATVIAGSPGVVDTKTWRGPADVYNDNLAHLRDIARDLAKANGMPFANVHDAMMDAMKQAKAEYGADYHVAGGDGVHPSANGQLVMAFAFLKTMGFDGNLGAITLDAGGRATATGGHKVLASAPGKAEIESTRYPFCFYGDAKFPDSTRSILPFLPFNQDLNRLTLVVKGLQGAKAKVTWGEASRTFTREQLAGGVNLAAEFLDNPFSEPFRKVDQKIAEKQNYETWLIKDFNRLAGGILHQTAGDAEAAAAVQGLREKLLAKHAALAKAVREAFVPVKHTITVEAE